jgi:hypothetical protein
MYLVDKLVFGVVVPVTVGVAPEQPPQVDHGLWSQFFFVLDQLYQNKLVCLSKLVPLAYPNRGSLTEVEGSVRFTSLY